MPIAFNSPVGTYIGPGFRVFVVGVSGPVAAGDYLDVVLNRASDGSGFSYGVLTPVVAGVNLVTIGWDALSGRIVEGTTDGMPGGTAMTCEAIQHHADGTTVESIPPTAFGLLDLHSYAWCLLRYAARDGEATLGRILADVEVNWPSTP